MHSPSTLKEEAEADVLRLKLDKSPGVDNLLPELVTKKKKNGDKELVKALTALCQWIWKQKMSPKE